MAGMNTVSLSTEGVKSMKNYFLSNLLALVLVLVAFILIVVGALGSALGVIIPGVVLIVIGVAAGIFAVISLLCGLRDLRRSNLPGNKVYEKMNMWLKWLIIVAIIAFTVIYSALIISALQDPLAFLSSGSNSSFSVVTIVVDLVIGGASAYIFYTVYSTLGKDLSQNGLGLAAKLFVAVYVVALIVVVISAASTSGQTTTMASSLAAGGLLIVVLVIVIIVLELIMYWLGYSATNAYLKKGMM